MSDDFNKLRPFRFWCQKVLPLVYDNSLSYYELLCKVVDYLNKTMEDVNSVIDLTETFTTEQAAAYAAFTAGINATVASLMASFNTLQSFVDNYFDNLDVQEEINTKLDTMATDGTLSNMVRPVAAAMIPALVAQWLADNITPTTPALDKTLTITGAAADARETGYRLAWFGDSYAWTNNMQIDVLSGLQVGNQNYACTAKTRGTIHDIIGIRAISSIPDAHAIALYKGGEYVGFYTYGIVSGTAGYYYIAPGGATVPSIDHDEYSISWFKNTDYPNYDWIFRRPKMEENVNALQKDLALCYSLSLVSKTTNSTSWATGQYRIADGQIRAESSRIRMYDFLAEDVQYIVSKNAQYKLILAAWEKTTINYVGWWDGSNFVTSTTNYMFDILNLNAIRYDHPNYLFKLMIQAADISISDAIQYIILKTPTPFVTPYMFGAAGDGITDDTAAIKACMLSEANIVIIPNGTFLVSETINISKSKTIYGGNKSHIFMPSQENTTYIFSASGIDLNVTGITFSSVHDKADASIFERDSASVFSNVRGFLINSCNNVVIDKCNFINLESLMFADIASGNGNGTIDVLNCNATYTQMFMFAANVNKISVSHCTINHSNSSRLDHTFYFAHNNNNIYIDNVKSYGCKGISVHFYAVEGYASTFNNAYVNDCIISAQNGCIASMYGNIYINGGVFKCIANNSVALRNKGGKMICTDSTIENCNYLLFSEKGSGANTSAIPNTIIKCVNAICAMIEGYNDTNNVGGKREFFNCNIEITRTGTFNGIIIADEITAEYNIFSCNITKKDEAETSALIYSNIGSIAKIVGTALSRGLSICNGLTDNVTACNNVAYLEKGEGATGTGIFNGNIILN